MRRLFLSLRVGAFASALLLWAALPALPQSSNGSVRGTVQDPTKAVIPGAPISLVNTATGIELKTTANGEGIFVYPVVTPGPYRIEALSPGMAKFEGDLEVHPAQSTSLDIILQPAGAQVMVKVEDISPMVTTDSPTLSYTLDHSRIEQLPINGRNIMNLMNTVPGLTFDNGGNLRTFGTRGGTHDVIVDGAALTDELYGGGTVTRPPSLDSIQEVHVETNSSSAKFTRQTSIVMTTKNGTNQLHGSLFETNRDYGYGVARARDNFTNTAAKYIRNEYGGTVGGPIIVPKLYNGKNKSFWFFAYEGYKFRGGAFGNFRVPTQAMRDGDFSGLVNAAGTFTTIYDPLTTGADGRRLPFNYGGKINNIDPSRISPLAKYMYSVLPLPNIPGVNPLIGDNYSAPRPRSDDQYTWSSRFDQRISDKDLIYGRIAKSMASNYQPASGGVPTSDGFGNSRTNTYPNESLSVDWTRTFTPTLVNEFMFSASRTVVTNFSGDASRKYSTELGLPNPNGQPGYPVINNIGVGTGASNYFQPINWNLQFFNYFILEDNGTKVKGRHEFQFGIHLRHDQLNYMPQQQRTAGAVTFAPNTTAQFDPAASSPTNRVAQLNTGDVGAAAYLGYAVYEVRVAKGFYYMRQNEDSAYLQDNFKVNKRLTLNLGLRWQFSPYPYDKYNIMSSFDKKNNAIVLGTDLDTMYKVGATTPALINVLKGFGAKFESAKEAGLPSKLVNDNWHDIGPHVGFAYRALDGRKSFVLRGGFSTSYNVVPIYGWNDRMRLNAPFAAFYQNYQLTAADQSPDGLGNYGLVSVPTIIAGKNSANAVSFDKPLGITPGSESFQVAYFNPSQPSSRVHDWNLTLEKEVMRDTVVRVSYRGNHAAYQDSYDDWNAPIPSYVWYQTKHLSLPTGTYSQSLIRPNPTLPYGNLQEYRKDGSGNANGITAEVERRFSKGIGFQLFYSLVNANKAAAHGWYSDSSLAPVSSFLPNSVPDDHDKRARLLWYQRDITVPQHEIRWNWIAALPFGKGKLVAGNSNKFLDALIGGWHVTGLGRWRTNWMTLPTNLWPTGTPVEYYGHKYKIQDCRSGICRPGYLLWNGYIPANLINSVDKNGKPNGVMGVPDNYKPSAAPLYPYPADYASRSAATDPNYTLYGNNYVFIPLTDTTTPVRVTLNGSQPPTGSPLHPWINQPLLSTGLWTVDAGLNKNFALKERLKLRVQFDFFNVFNVQGDAFAAGNDGIVPTWTSQNTPRTMQMSARLTW